MEPTYINQSFNQESLHVAGQQSKGMYRKHAKLVFFAMSTIALSPKRSFSTSKPTVYPAGELEPRPSEFPPHLLAR